MSITWGTLQLEHNAQFEQECLAQARAELKLPLNCNAADAMKVLLRAQVIKFERRGNQ